MWISRNFQECNLVKVISYAIFMYNQHLCLTNADAIHFFFFQHESCHSVEVFKNCFIKSVTSVDWGINLGNKVFAMQALGREFDPQFSNESWAWP